MITQSTQPKKPAACGPFFMLGRRASQRLKPYRLTSMASRGLKPHEIDANKIAVDSGAGTEVVGSTKTEMTKRITARNPYETLPYLNRAIEPRPPPPRFSSVLTILITMVSRMVRIWVEKNRKASRMKLWGGRDGRAEGRCARRHQEGDCRLRERQRRNGLRGRRQRRKRVGRRRRRRVRLASLQHGARRRETGRHHVRQLRSARLRREGGRGRQVNLNPSHSRRQVDFRSP